MSYDAIVVGAGISGAATAYQLKQAGAKTLLLERGEPASGGTGKSAAIIRQSYSTPLLVRLARVSITMFENAGGKEFIDVSQSMGNDFLRVGYQRGSAFADLNNDGFLDVVVTSLNEKPRLLLKQLSISVINNPSASMPTEASAQTVRGSQRHCTRLQVRGVA